MNVLTWPMRTIGSWPQAMVKDAGSQYRCAARYALLRAGSSRGANQSHAARRDYVGQDLQGVYQRSRCPFCSPRRSNGRNLSARTVHSRWYNLRVIGGESTIVSRSNAENRILVQSAR